MLKPNTTYYYRVKSVTTEEESLYSNPIQVTTLPSSTNIDTVDPLTPILLDIKHNQLKIKTSLPEEFLQAYRIVLSINSDYSSPIYNNTLIQYDSLNPGSEFVKVPLPGLSSNTLYYGKIAAINELSISGEVEFTFTSDSELATPIYIGCTNIDANSFTVNWSKVIGATSYVLDVASDAAFSLLVVNNLNVGDVEFHDVAGLSADTLYYIRVKALNATTESKYFSTSTMKTLTGVETYADNALFANTLTIQSIYNVHDTGFKIQWNKITDAVNYTIDIDIDNAFSSPTTVTVKTLTYEFTDLSPDTVYYIRITAYNPYQTVEATFTTKTLYTDINLSSVQVYTPTSVYTKSAVVTFVPKVYATEYKAEIASDNLFNNIIYTIYTTQDTVTLQNLTVDTTYYVRIFAKTNTSISNASNIAEFTTSTALPDIVVNEVTKLTSSTVQLNWTTNAAYDSYAVTVSNNKNKSYITNYLSNVDVGFVNSYYLDIFLEPDTEYTYRIIGTTFTGDTNMSVSTTFKTLPKAPVLSYNDYVIHCDTDINKLQISVSKSFIQATEITVSLDENNNYELGNWARVSGEYYYIRGQKDNSYKSNIINTKPSKPSIENYAITKNSIVLYMYPHEEYITYLTVSNNDTPITGYTVPVDITYKKVIIIDNLTEDLDYEIKLESFEFNNPTSSIITTKTIHTNPIDSLSELTENVGLVTPNVTLTNEEYDRVTLNFSGTFDYYYLNVSPHSSIEGSNYFIYDTTFQLFLTKGYTYYYKVYGISGTEYSPVATGNFTLSDNIVSYPNLSSGPTITSNTVLNDFDTKITWSTLPDATDYIIEVSTDSLFGSLAKCSIELTDINEAIISVLDKDITHYVRVMGSNPGYLSPYSGSVSI